MTAGWRSQARRTPRSRAGAIWSERPKVCASGEARREGGPRSTATSRCEAAAPRVTPSGSAVTDLSRPDPTPIDLSSTDRPASGLHTVQTSRAASGGLRPLGPHRPASPAVHPRQIRPRSSAICHRSLRGQEKLATKSHVPAPERSSVSRLTGESRMAKPRPAARRASEAVKCCSSGRRCASAAEPRREGGPRSTAT